MFYMILLIQWKPTVQLEIDLERSMHRTGDVWHIQLKNLGQYTRYGYRCKVNFCIHDTKIWKLIDTVSLFQLLLVMS